MACLTGGRGCEWHGMIKCFRAVGVHSFCVSVFIFIYFYSGLKQLCVGKNARQHLREDRDREREVERGRGRESKRERKRESCWPTPLQCSASDVCVRNMCLRNVCLRNVCVRNVCEEHVCEERVCEPLPHIHMWLWQGVLL